MQVLLRLLTSLIYLSDLSGMPEHTTHQHISDLLTAALQQLAQTGGSFEFLEHPGEDVYTEHDGVPVLTAINVTSTS